MVENSLYMVGHNYKKKDFQRRNSDIAYRLIMYGIVCQNCEMISQNS